MTLAAFAVGLCWAMLHAWHVRWAAFWKVYGVCSAGLILALLSLLVIANRQGPSGWGALVGVIYFIPVMALAAAAAGVASFVLGRLRERNGRRRLEIES